MNLQPDRRNPHQQVAKWLGCSLLLPLLALFSASGNADYADDWGPETGANIPVLQAYDQDGELRSLDNLTGSQGLLLFLNRSADW